MGTKKVVIVVDDEDMLNLENASTILKDISYSHNDYLLEILTLDHIVKCINQGMEKSKMEINIPLCDQCLVYECNCRGCGTYYCTDFVQDLI